MKLFLSSIGVPRKSESAFLKLFNKQTNINVAFIANAADNYSDGTPEFVDTSIERFRELGVNAELIDLRVFKSSDEMYRVLSSFNCLWLSGGNTWNLRYIAQKTGFDTIVRDLVESGIVYGGESAGAIIATPTIRYSDIIDDPDEAPEKIDTGFNLVEFTIVPHWDKKPYHNELQKMKTSLEGELFEVVTLGDNHALVVDDISRTIID